MKVYLFNDKPLIYSILFNFNLPYIEIDYEL